MNKDKPSIGERVATLGLGAIITGSIVALPRHAPRLFLINESPSLPRGLYLRAWDQRLIPGAVVAVPQPPGARSYLGRLGMPPPVLLIKRIAGVSGDLACEGPGRLQLSGRTLNVATQDRLGARLPQWRECRRLASSELFLLGDSPESFDSRYFGPVSAAQVEGVFREVLTW